MADENVASALEAAFGDGPPPAAAKPAAAPAPVAPEPEVSSTAAEAEAIASEALGEPPEGEPPADEAPPEGPVPEFVIEVDGEQQVVSGAEQIKELLQKGAHYSKNNEINARTRDSLTVQAKAMQEHAQFNQAMFADMAQLQAIDAQLARFQQVDMAAEFERDPFAAMKLKEQRDQWREARQAKVQEIQAKEAQFKQGQAQAARQLEGSERTALLAKLPEWRNSETAGKEQAAIATTLQSYGFTEAEIAGVLDHRYVLVARDAMRWRALQQGKDSRIKQVREAPPVVKPGAVATPAIQGQAKFKEATRTLRSLGRKGDHRAQEALASKMLERAFK